MARVPEYQRQVRDRAINQQSVRVNTSADTFGAGVGRANQQLGGAVMEAGDALAYEQALLEEANAEQAFNNYRYDQREALNSPDGGFLNRTGGNAIGIKDEAEDSLDALEQRHGEGLSPRAKKVYNQRVANLQDQAHGRLLTHGSNEKRNYITNERKATIDGYLEEAATNWDNPDLFDENLGLAMQQQERLADLEGWDGATRQNAAEALVSKALRNRIVSAAAQDPLAAEALLEQSRDALNEADEYALDTSLKEMVLDAKSSKFVQEFVTDGTPLGNVSGRANGVSFEFSLGPNRPNRPSDDVLNVVGNAVQATFGAGARVVVTSGQETDKNRDGVIDHKEQHGSNRHGTGLAADFAVYRADGTKVRATDPDAKEFARAAAQAGALGIGFGEGYMGGDHFHMDLVMPGAGQAHTWGVQGRNMRPELVQLMRRGAASALKQNNMDATKVNTELTSRLGITGASAIVNAAEITPSLPATVALDPKLIQANPAYEHMTVAEVYDSIASAVGDSPAIRQGGKYFDTEAAFQRALEIEDPALQKKVFQQIQSINSMQNSASSAARARAQEEGWRHYTQTGDIPYHLRTDMGQSGWTSFESAVQSDQQSTITTDPDTWEMLTRAASNSQTFAEMNLAAHYGNLSESDRRHFIGVQEAAKAAVAGELVDTEKDRNSIDFDKVYKAAEPVYQAMVDQTSTADLTQEKRQQRLEFQKQLTQMTKDFFDRERREPNTSEVREMAAVLSMPITLSTAGAGFMAGGFDGVDVQDKKFFEAANRPAGASFDIELSYDDVPTADRAKIAARLIATNGGRLPTNDEIVETYEQQRLIDVGLPPNVDLEQVPSWLIESEKQRNPEVTDEELVLLYQRYLIER